MKSRHIIFFKTIALNSIFYFGTGYLPFLNPREISPVTLDGLIGFSPYGVYPYFSFFFMIWLAIATARSKDALELAKIIPATAFLAAIMYVVFPMQVSSAPFDVAAADPLTELIYFLMRADRSLTYMPSLHGAITVICVCYLGKRRSRAIKVGLVMWGLSIYWSAISLRQHLSADIFVGMLFGIATMMSRHLIFKAIEWIDWQLPTRCKLRLERKESDSRQ